MADRLTAFESNVTQGITWRDVAWYFEGEGSVGYYRVSRGSPGYYLFVRITSSNWWILDRINRSLESIGSILRSAKPGSFSGGVLHKKGSWNLTWTCGKAFYVLRRLSGYLPSCSEKHAQIEFCLRAGDTVDRRQAEELKAMKSYTSAKLKE